MSNIPNNDIIDPPVPKAYLDEAASENASAAKSSSGLAGIFSKLGGTAARLSGRSSAASASAITTASSTAKCPTSAAKSLCELPYFKVDEMLGGNQELFSDPWMKIGGCAAVTDSIDAGFPIPYLNLYHRDPAFSDFVWHWFLLTGYTVYADAMLVKVISYGECYWFDLAKLLNTGHRRKGGMVRVNSILPK